MMGPKRVDKVRRKLDMAGNPGGMTVDRYAARRAVYGGLGAIAALAMLMNGQPILAVLLAVYGFFWTDVIIRAAIGRRKDDIDRTLPDFLDVLAVVVSMRPRLPAGAGEGLREVLGPVGRRTPHHTPPDGYGCEPT